MFFQVIASINPRARVLSCVQGAVADPLALIGSAKAAGAANWGVLDDHRNLVSAVEQEEEARAAHSLQHEHEHEHVHGAECDHAGTCTDPTHHHDHKGHGHEHEHEHGHGHGHDRAADAAAAHCEVEACTDPTHNHDHSHGHDHDHDHSGHNHDHSGHNHGTGSSSATTAEARFGITSFVYKRRRPFHPVRFSLFLQGLGKLSVKGVAAMSRVEGSGSGGASGGLKEGKEEEEESALQQAKRSLLRSKGFVWMGTSSEAAYFMSHAGQYLELLALGRWWAAIDEQQWPQAPEVRGDITADFDPAGGPHGDRRQELVFIGQFGKNGGSGSGGNGSVGGAVNSQAALERVLDACLLTDAEMRDYERLSKKGGDDALREHFAPNY